MKRIVSARLWSGVGLALVLAAGAACSGSTDFHGTALSPADAAPPFDLLDHFGEPIALSDLAGKVVVLAFLYTSCPDVCPITTESLRRTHQLLGSDTGEVEFLAITVDPQRDSVERAYQYSEEKDMLGRWHFLVGDEERLVPIWQAYWLDPVRELSAGGNVADDHGDEEGALGTKLDAGSSPDPGEADDGYLVSHVAPVFLIDRDGQRRVLFTNLSLDPQPLLHDIRLLIK